MSAADHRSAHQPDQMAATQQAAAADQPEQSATAAAERVGARVGLGEVLQPGVVHGDGVGRIKDRFSGTRLYIYPCNVDTHEDEGLQAMVPYNPTETRVCPNSKSRNDHIHQKQVGHSH